MNKNISQPTDATPAVQSIAATPTDPRLSLKSQQLRAYGEIHAWVQSFNLGHASSGRILAGYAGSGKTFLIRSLAATVFNLVPTVLCAPTNQAVKELQRLDTGLPCCTIYSLLGLKMEQHEDKLRLTKATGNKAYKYQYVILDECSMIAPELYEPHILDAMRSGTRFLFVGDPKQLPPVGHRLSLVWGKFETSVLTEVIRHDNQILDLATRIRTTKLQDLVLCSDNNRSEGVWRLSHDQFEERIRKHTRAGLFESAETKIVCWRNATADRYNHVVRHQMYGSDVFKAQFHPGDKIVFTSPHTVSTGYISEVEIFTDDQATVIDSVVAQHTDYDLLCCYLTVDVYGRRVIVKIIHRDSQETLELMLTGMATEARRTGRRELWQDFWKLRESLASVKYAHALTVHRAQGSTYTNIFADVSDILANSDRAEARKCLYVASTRPTTKLYLT